MARIIAIGLVAAFLLACSDSGLTSHEGYIKVEGGKVWYQIAGSGSATPLLLLHGGPGAPRFSKLGVPTAWAAAVCRLALPGPGSGRQRTI